MGKGVPQQLVKIQRFPTSDLAYLFSISKLGRLQSFTRSSLFVITLSISGYSGHTEGQLTPNRLSKINCSDIVNKFLPPKLSQKKRLC